MAQCWRKLQENEPMERNPHPRFSSNYFQEDYSLDRHLLHLHFNLDLPIYPFCFENDIRRLDNVWYESEGVNFMMVVALECGRSLYRINGRQYTLVPGKALLIPEFQPYHLSSSGYMHKYILEVKGSHLTSILASMQLNQTALYDVENFPAFLDSLKAIGTHCDTNDLDEFISISGKCYELLMQLALQVNHRKRNDTALPRILEFLEMDFERKVTIADLEEHVGLGKMSIIRMMKKFTGMTPMQYRLSRKIERAIYYLQIPGISIKEIAYRLGFCNQFHFAREFRRRAGRTPSDYRNWQQKITDQNHANIASFVDSSPNPPPSAPGDSRWQLKSTDG